MAAASVAPEFSSVASTMWKLVVQGFRRREAYRFDSLPDSLDHVLQLVNEVAPPRSLIIRLIGRDAAKSCELTTNEEVKDFFKSSGKVPHITAVISENQNVSFSSSSCSSSFFCNSTSSFPVEKSVESFSTSSFYFLPSSSSLSTASFISGTASSSSSSQLLPLPSSSSLYSASSHQSFLRELLAASPPSSSNFISKSSSSFSSSTPPVQFTPPASSLPFSLDDSLVFLENFGSLREAEKFAVLCHNGGRGVELRNQGEEKDSSAFFSSSSFTPSSSSSCCSFSSFSAAASSLPSRPPQPTASSSYLSNIAGSSVESEKLSSSESESSGDCFREEFTEEEGDNNNSTSGSGNSSSSRLKELHNFGKTFLILNAKKSKIRCSSFRSFMKSIRVFQELGTLGEYQYQYPVSAKTWVEENIKKLNIPVYAKASSSTSSVNHAVVEGLSRCAISVGAGATIRLGVGAVMRALATESLSSTAAAAATATTSGIGMQMASFLMSPVVMGIVVVAGVIWGLVVGIREYFRISEDVNETNKILPYFEWSVNDDVCCLRYVEEEDPTFSEKEKEEEVVKIAVANCEEEKEEEQEVKMSNPELTVMSEEGRSGDFSVEETEKNDEENETWNMIKFVEETAV